jgi:Domain of unknown function (DUF5658)
MFAIMKKMYVIKTRVTKEMSMVPLFHYLSLLNLLDAFITFYGLEREFIIELNPIMNRLYQFSPVLFILVKLSFSIFLYLFILYKRVPTSKVIQGVVSVASFLYTIVFALHIWWLVLTF